MEPMPKRIQGLAERVHCRTEKQKLLTPDISAHGGAQGQISRK